MLVGVILCEDQDICELIDYMVEKQDGTKELCEMCKLDTAWVK